MAARSSAQLRMRLGVVMLGFVCALLISAGAVAREPRQPAAKEPAEAAAPAARPTPTPAPAPAFARVLTEREKRCRAARGCAMDGACPPCDR